LSIIGPVNHSRAWGNLVRSNLDDPEDVDLVGLIAYGLHKRDKAQEIQERRERGDDDSQSAMIVWANAIPASHWIYARDKASQVLEQYAIAVVDDERPQIVEKALEGSAGRAIWHGILGNLAFTLLLVACWWVLLKFGVPLPRLATG
jgi:hypothetical protein